MSYCGRAPLEPTPRNGVEVSVRPLAMLVPPRGRRRGHRLLRTENMFVIEDALDYAGHPSHAVVDHERRATLQLLAGNGREPGYVFTLETANMLIPFDVSTKVETTGSGEYRYIKTFVTFGYSPRARLLADVKQTLFQSKDERDNLQLLATEALLIYGGFYDGLSRPEGSVCVDWRGKRYSLASFGYRGSHAQA